MVNTPPSTGNAQLDGFLRSVADDLHTLSKPREGWRLSDFAADVSEAISDRRDLIDIVGNWSDINQIKATFEAEVTRYEKLYADSKILGDKYQDHAEIFAQIMEWWAQNYKLIENAQSSADNVITPQDFGAKADGVTDDTQAIQAALDSVPSSGGVVVFPAGVYLVSGQRLRHGSQDTKAAIFPKPNTTLRGEGPGSIIRLNDGTEKVDMVYAFETPGLGFENITIDAGPRLLPYWTTCIQLNTCNDLVMRNVTVVNGNIEGVYVFNSTGFDINGIHAHHNGAFREDASGLHMDSCYGGNIDNINAHHNGFHGVIISSSWEINLSNIQARHNGWQGLHIQTGSNKINVSNAVLTNNARGLYIRDWGTDNNIFNNLTVAHNSFSGVMTYVTYGNVINGLQAISNGEYGVQTGVNEDELFVWAGHFKDNGWGDYDSVDDSKLYINGTLV